MIESLGGGTLFAIVGVGLLVLAGLAAYESWALFTSHRPITSYVRQGIAEHPHWAALVAFVAGLLGGHWWR